MGKQWKQWQTLFLGVPKSLQMVTAAVKLKDTYSLEENLWPNLDSIFKSRDITLTTKVRLVKAMVFPVVMYLCDGSSWMLWSQAPYWQHQSITDIGPSTETCLSWESVGDTRVSWFERGGSFLHFLMSTGSFPPGAHVSPTKNANPKKQLTQ